MRANLAMAFVFAICLAAVSACGGGEEGPTPTASPTTSPPATEEASPTAAPSEATEAALREVVTAYERALARFDLATAYALESAEFRETCPFEEYEELIAPSWPGFLSDCGFDEASEIGFVIENLEMGENWAAVYGCHEDQDGRRCCYPDDKLGDYTDGQWVLGSTVPCVYAQENERLLATVPELPGAQQASIESTLYSSAYEGIPDRHSIRVTYQAPADTTDEDVIDFYVEGLAGDWDYQIEELPVGQKEGGILSAAFIQGTAEISISTTGISVHGSGRFDVHVDARGARPTPVPVDPAAAAERDARVREILLESKVGRALLAGREEGRDYWVIDISHFWLLLHGERAARVTIAFAEPVSYEGEIPTASDPCRGTRGEYDPDDPCHDERWEYGTEYAAFSDMREFHFTVEVDRGELIGVFAMDTPADIVDDMIEWAKSRGEQ
jgi:hypothetical protein